MDQGVSIRCQYRDADLFAALGAFGDQVRGFRSVQSKQPVLRLLRTTGDIRDTALAEQHMKIFYSRLWFSNRMRMACLDT